MPRARGLYVFIFTSALVAAAAWAAPHKLPAAASAPRAAAIVTVTTRADDGSAGSLRQTIAAAAAGDIINFAPNVTGTIVLTRGELKIDKNLTINGPGKNLLTLSGAHPSTGKPDVRVFDIGGVSASVTVTISGLTIESGTDDFDNEKNGGGIRNRATLFIKDCNVQKNVAGAEGGGLYNDGGTVTIDNSDFLNNRSGQGGGGVFNKGGTIIIRNGSTFSKNACNTGGGGGISNRATLTIENSRVFNNSSREGTGGGIFSSGTVSFTNSELSGNASLSKGAGLYVSGGTVTIGGSIIADNFTEQSGGGVYISSGTVTITRSTVRHNSANDNATTDDDPTNDNLGNGGGISNEDGTLNVTACTFSDNRAKDFGGAIHNQESNANIFDSTVSNNTAGASGGGIYNKTGFVALRSSTVVSNTAASLTRQGQGGGVFFVSSAQGSVTLANTVVALNVAGVASDISGKVTTQGFNLIGKSQGATVTPTTGDILNKDPRLGPLQDNGGPTLTHAPLDGSPLIDAGKSASANDQRGLLRRFDQPPAGGAAGSDASDIGAFELQPIKISGRVTDANGAGVGGVALTLSGKQTAVTSTKADGSYSFDNVPPGASFTVTPSKPDFEFTPASSFLAAKDSLQNQQFDFKANLITAPTPTPSPSDDFDDATSANFKLGLLTKDPAAFNPDTIVTQGGSLTITPPTFAEDYVQARVACGSFSGSGTNTDCEEPRGGLFLEDGSFDGDSFNGYVANNALDLNVTTSVSVEVKQTVVGDGAQTAFSVGKDEDNYVGLRVAGTAPAQAGGASLQKLLFDIVLGGKKSDTPEVNYDDKKHRYWRIRLDAPASQIIFETSRDRLVWDNPCPLPETCRFPIGGASTEVIAQLIAGTVKRVDDAGTASFDDYRVARPTGIGFATTNIPATEKDRSIPVKLTRTGDVDSRASVDYTLTGGGTSFPGGTVTFAERQRDATFTITNPFPDDTLRQPDRVLTITLAPNAKGGALITDFNAASVIVTDDDPAPALSINDVTVTEGNAGTVNATFTVTLSGASSQAVNVNYATADGTATVGSDYTAVASTALRFAPGETTKTVAVVVNGDTLDEPNETFFVNLSGATDASILDSQGVGTITDDDGAPSLTIDNVSVTEGNTGTTTAAFTVSLLPASGQTVTVNYATADGTATTADGDYASASGTLTFTPGQTSKAVNVNVNGDTTPEPHENFVVNLTGETNAAVADAQGQGTITDDDNFNKIDDDPVFFTSQQYCDFLNRPADAPGLAFWSAQFDHCARDIACIERERVHVSAAFFFSIEFQETGYFVYRAYQATFGRAPRRDEEFLPDARKVRGCVVVNQGEWQKELEANKRDFLNAWMQRPAFKAKYDPLDSGEFVDTLYQTAGVALSVQRRTELVLSLLTGQTTRRKVFGGLLDSKAQPDAAEAREAKEFRLEHFNRAFVLMQYFGYLERDPDAEGFQHWLDKLDRFNGDFAAAEMVKAFVNSDEYKNRFKNRLFATCVGQSATCVGQ